MRKTLLALAVLGAFAVPAGAHASVNRQIATIPDVGGSAKGYLRAWRYDPLINWQTWVSACCYVPDIHKPQNTASRPASDLYAADQAVRHFWPGCAHEWYGVNDQRSVDNSYRTFYRISC